VSLHDETVSLPKDPRTLFDLNGRVAVVTGGSRGIGRAVVLGYAAAGAHVVIASRKLEACEAVAAEVRATTGRRALAVACNVSLWESCDRLVEIVYAEMGTCDILVNNAGSSPLYPDLESVTEEYYNKVHGLNARGPFRLSALIGTRMHRGTGGSIINVSTVGSLRPGANELVYAMAKAGMNALTQGLVDAFAPKVRANTVLPGPFATEVARSSYWLTGGDEQIKEIGQPDELVGICLYLASDAAAYTNGATIEVSQAGWRP
jgi:NAD(P)-dependent dehydrogenase (short-subunit alcohol dehydrogenase family)